jgi:hypothetical protein
LAGSASVAPEVEAVVPVGAVLGAFDPGVPALEGFVADVSVLDVSVLDVSVLDTSAADVSSDASVPVSVKPASRHPAYPASKSQTFV